MYRLRCKYYEGMFSHEYFITFCPQPPSEQQNWYFVNKEDVEPIDGINGLVRVELLALERDRCLIGINDVGDHRESRFYVKAEDVKGLNF